ncbi:23S rRNA (uracil(1939)-C(5))-methyltransferase RlmD [Povalibacter sp.]|uniref:23S rRNA (uracil(1939)-C(5))-methyltransferase RlmD n=1 Tax=Povalibacter sp. TaxID=1962978 RepID=UPI002F3E64BC
MNARSRARVSSAPQISTIEDLSHEGRGVTHHDGKVVFIEDALPGERVEWLRTKRGPNFDEARLLKVLEPSPDRVTPKCVHFGVCGGCASQHLSSDRQIEFKQRQLTDALARIGKVSPPRILEPLQADAWNYRRRARLGARWVPKKQRVVVGFKERSTSYIADLQRCEILRPPVDAMIPALSALLTSLSIPNRIPQIEVSVADAAVALVIRVLEPLTAADMEHLHAFEKAHDVRIYLQPGGYETVAPLRSDLPPLTYALPQFDVTLQFLPTDFVQVNGPLNELMVDRVIQLLQLTAEDTVLDLFCGLGNFSLPLARRAKHVVGVEGEASLVARARDNAARNGLTNTEFFTANLAAEDLQTSGWAKRRYDKVLLDPPRAGALEALPVVAATRPNRIVYVSCHPGTLARDAGVLVNQLGYELTEAGVMDMFPHTAHVESVAVFERIQKKKK